MIAFRMAEFSFQVYLSESGRFVRIDVQGVMTGESVSEFMTEALKVAEESRVDRFLLDVREARNTWVPLKKVAYARPAASGVAGRIKDVLRVVLVSPNDRSHDLVVQTLQARGHRISMSRDEASAIRMLERGGES
ncbi:MAG: hypothetical protein WD492_13015 [Alkalispirochaeta sp.]